MLRRRFNKWMIYIGLWFLMFPKNANAISSAEEKLFKKALNYIAQIIIRYYGNTWYENTKKQMEDFSKYNQENTEDEKSQLRENLGRLADSYNQVLKSQADNDLKIETEPNIYQCEIEAVNTNGIKAEKAVSLNVIDKVNTSKLIGGKPISEFDNPVAINDFSFELLTDVLGYDTSNSDNQYMRANSLVEKILGPEPKLNSFETEIRSGETINYQNRILSKLAMRNATKSSLNWLINKRRKVSLEQQYDASMDKIVSAYNPEKGISYLESIAIQVDMYSAGSEFMSRINEYAGMTPLMSTICEMTALENKLMHDIMTAQIELSRLEAYDLLNKQKG